MVTSRLMFMDGPADGPTAFGGGMDPEPTRQRRIIVVDDEEKLSRFVRICLERDGFFVVTSATVAETQPLIEEQQWDLVITDLIMPIDSGFSLLQWLKETVPSLPVVVMTAHSSDLVHHQAIQLGAVDVLYKPFSLDELRETVHNALN